MKRPADQTTAQDGKSVSEHLVPSLTRRPLGLGCLALLLGIGLQDRAQFLCAIWAAILLFAAVAVLGSGLWRHRVACAVLALPVGGLLHAIQTRPPPDDVARYLRPGLPQRLEGVVLQEQVSARGYQRWLVETSRVAGHRARGRILVSAPRTVKLAVGSEVAMTVTSHWPRRVSNPGEIDYGAILQRRHVRGVVYALGVEPGRQVRWWTRTGAAGLLARAREFIVRRLARSMGKDSLPLDTALLGSVVYGVSAVSVPKWVADDFRDAGTIHLLVVSGAQVTFVLLLVTGQWRRLFGWQRGQRRTAAWRLLVALAAAVAFAILIGLGPSLQRAVFFAVVGVLCTVTRRDFDPLTAFALTAAAICAVDTNALFDLSAQLAFAGAIGVVVALRARPRGVPPHGVAQVAALARGGLVSLRQRAAAFLKEGVVALLRAQAAVWLLTTPILAYHFDCFPLLGALANLICIPACAVLLILGVAATFLSLLHPVLAAPVCWLARGPILVLLHTSALFARLPLARVQGFHLPAWACVVWYVGVVVCALFWRLRWRIGSARRWVAGAALAVASLVGIALVAQAWSQPLAVTVLDTGGGACVVVQAPGGRAVMVDAGSPQPSGGERLAEGVILPFLQCSRIGHLDVLLLTHSHDDHTNAAAALQRRMRIDAVWGPPQSIQSPEHTPRAGMTFRLGGGVVGEILWPAVPALAGTDDDVNNNSVVTRLRCGERSVLLVGDLQTEGELALLARGADVRADVLVVGHHGRPDATSLAFLRQVQPADAIISCASGADCYAPDGGALARLRTMGVRIWRTDVHGAVRACLQGRTVRVEALGSNPGRVGCHEQSLEAPHLCGIGLHECLQEGLGVGPHGLLMLGWVARGEGFD